MCQERETVMSILVVLTVPEHMTHEQVERDLATCISFGSPVITTIADVPAARADQVRDDHSRFKPTMFEGV